MRMLRWESGALLTVLHSSVAFQKWLIARLEIKRQDGLTSNKGKSRNENQIVVLESINTRSINSLYFLFRDIFLSYNEKIHNNFKI